MTGQYVLEFGSAAFTLLAEVSVRVAVLVAVAGIALAIIRPRRAALEHGVWSAVLVGTLLLVPASLLPERVELQASPSAAAFAEAAPTAASATPFKSEPVATHHPVSNPFSYPGLLALFSFAVSAVLLLRYAALALLLRRRIARAEPMQSPVALSVAQQLGLDPVPRLVASDRLHAPAVFGGSQPVVVLPLDWSDWNPSKLRAVLSHEFAHAARGDGHILALSNFAVALLWFHPAIHWLRFKLRALAESACDDHAVLVSGAPAIYAETLFEIASDRRSPHAAPVASAMAGSSNVARRIERVLSAARIHSGMLAVTVRRRLLVAAAAISIALSLVSVGLAQSRGVTFAGTVEDAAGARIPSAVILVVDRNEGATETARSQPDGSFRIERLPPSETYEVAVRAQGFTTQSQVLEITSDLNHQVILEVASVQEEIIVSGTRPQAQAAPKAGPRSRIRVGGAVERAKLLTYVAPEYPSSAEQEGVEGTVLIEAMIDPEGVPGDIRTLNTLIDPRLAGAATDAFRQWRYKPVLLNGKPVEAAVAATIVFQLP